MIAYDLPECKKLCEDDRPCCRNHIRCCADRSRQLRRMPGRCKRRARKRQEHRGQAFARKESGIFLVRTGDSPGGGPQACPAGSGPKIIANLALEYHRLRPGTTAASGVRQSAECRVRPKNRRTPFGRAKIAEPALQLRPRPIRTSTGCEQRCPITESPATRSIPHIAYGKRSPGKPELR